MRRTNPDLSLDLTPLIDVVFLLLIFFMLSASFDETHWLEVQLPHIDDKDQVVENNNEPFVIGIDPDGQLQMNEKSMGKLDNEALKEYLVKHLPKDPVVVIHGDAKAPHASVVQLLDVLGQLQVKKLHIAAIGE